MRMEIRKEVKLMVILEGSNKNEAGTCLLSRLLILLNTMGRKDSPQPRSLRKDKGHEPGKQSFIICQIFVVNCH